MSRAIKPLLGTESVLALKRNGRAWSVEECLAEVDTPIGRAKLKAVLAKRPFPRCEAVPGRSGHFVRLDENGSRTLGQFVGRRFIPTKEE